MQKLVPYRGLRRKLVLAFDLGTTFSGVSYAILDPGQTPEVKGVTRFPAHEQINRASKIPTIIYYDQEGAVRAVGSEALREATLEKAQEENWVKAEWFKLHIRPKDSSSYDIASRIPPLPLDKTAIEVVADFLRYLLQCAKTYIKETHANGTELWDSVEDEIEYVISHPNGWEGFQQSQMRQAAVKAGLIQNSRFGHERLSFVTEGEASLHFAIRHGLPGEVMENGSGVVIIDAGGGTIDISAYRKPKYGKTFEETTQPHCHFCGSIFVSIHARLYLDDYLKDSEYHGDLEHIVRCFDRTTKIHFSDDEQPQFIKFGNTRENDPECNIRFGQLKLPGTKVAEFFQPSVQSIVDTVKEQVASQAKTYPISHLVLVGGFGSSEWLLKQLQKEFADDGLKVLRPELHVNKAVSDGAVWYHLSHMVTARIARFSYGTFRNVEFKPGVKEHEDRLDELLIRPSGRKLVPNQFSVMLAKGTRVSDEVEAKVQMWKEAETKDQLSTVSFDVICYKGRNEEVKWKDEDPSSFRKLARVEVDLSGLPLEPQTKKSGGTYYVAKYWVILLFNSAEVKAQMMWYLNGVEQRSPASLVFYQDT